MKIGSLKFRSVGPWVWFALALIVAAVPLFFAAGKAGPSVLSRGPEGWVGARAYLASQGVEIQLLDAPPNQESHASLKEDGAALITAFPWQASANHVSVEPWRRFVRRGGTLAVGYSGDAPGSSETTLFEALDSPVEEIRPPLPLAPLPWWRYQHEVWQLEPVVGDSRSASHGTSRAASLRAPRFVPQAPEGAAIHYLARTGHGELPLVFSFPLGQGRVLVLPAQAIANSYLAQSGNLDLLENMRQWLGDTWAVDEAAHGLRAVDPDSHASGGLAFDLFAFHLLLLYALAILALARRFGPPWREPPVRTGSARAFLLGLGSLHHRLGHHREAGRHLVQRLQELEPALDLEAQLESSPGNTPSTDGKSLVRLARRLATLRRGEPLQPE